MSIQMIKLGVGIPTLNRADLLIESLDSHYKLMPNIPALIIDNGKQNLWSNVGHRLTTIYTMSWNTGVAASWNHIANYFFNITRNCSHVLFLNDDVVLGRTENDIAAFIASHIEYDIIVSNKGFCSFILTKKAYDITKGFDENFYPAYFEDNDFMYRAGLTNLKVLHADFLNPSVFRSSMTLHKDKSTNSRFMNNKNYYEKKWGGEPGKERFDEPFNGGVVQIIR